LNIVFVVKNTKKNLLIQVLIISESHAHPFVIGSCRCLHLYKCYCVQSWSFDLNESFDKGISSSHMLQFSRSFRELPLSGDVM